MKNKERNMRLTIQTFLEVIVVRYNLQKSTFLHFNLKKELYVCTNLDHFLKGY